MKYFKNTLKEAFFKTIPQNKKSNPKMTLKNETKYVSLTNYNTLFVTLSLKAGVFFSPTCDHFVIYNFEYAECLRKNKKSTEKSTNNFNVLKIH